MNIFVSNLGFGVKRDVLEKHFSQYGEVSFVNIIIDRVTYKSRGFAYVNMDDNSSAENAIRELNGVMLDGRMMKVNKAKPTSERNNFY